MSQHESEPGPPVDEEAGGKVPAEQLEGDVPLVSDVLARIRAVQPARVKKKNTPAERLREQRMRQETSWRTIVFWVVLGLIVGGFILSSVVMCVYFFADPEAAEPTVIAAWFGAAVVQTIGLLAIITKSLFPEAGGPELKP